MTISISQMRCEVICQLLTAENCCHRDLNPGLPESLASSSSRAAFWVPRPHPGSCQGL